MLSLAPEYQAQGLKFSISVPTFGPGAPGGPTTPWKTEETVKKSDFKPQYLPFSDPFHL